MVSIGRPPPPPLFCRSRFLKTWRGRGMEHHYEMSASRVTGMGIAIAGGGGIEPEGPFKLEVASITGLRLSPVGQRAGLGGSEEEGLDVTFRALAREGRGEWCWFKTQERLFQPTSTGQMPQPRFFFFFCFFSRARRIVWW